jgi:sugar phosphate isomerase/epimerase
MTVGAPPSLTATEPVSHGLFAKKNLVAWCIVPFDSKKRGPEERAAMLEKLGFSKFAYDYRAEHIPTFDAEIEALKRRHIELTAWWFPTTLNDEAKMTLAVFEKHKVTPQLWVTGGGGPTKDEADQRARVVAEAARIRPIAEAAAKVGCRVALYNHGGWFGEPENQIAIIQELKLENVGIVYNEHHGHEHLDRFPELLQQMKPHLLCLNLNGMVKEGDRKNQKILQLGEGDLDLKLLKIVRDSGYTGLIGILGHTQDDAEQRLHDNLDGLDWLVPQLDGKPGGPKPNMRTPVPQPTAEKPKADQPKSISSSASTPTLTEGKFGKALNGRSGGALVKGRDEFRQFPLTVECWTKLADKGPFNILVAHELKSSGTHWELFSMAGSGYFTVYLPGFAPDHCRSDAMICDDKWHHVAMVLEPDRVRLFVDGKPVADQKQQRTAQATVPGDVGLATLVDRVIGCTGLVDEVRISKGVRDITAAPDKPFAPDEATLALWHLDEIADQKRLDDASPNKNAAIVGRVFNLPGPSSPNVSQAGSKPAPQKIEGHWGEDAVGFRWTEADSRDDRFGRMDTGPFFSGSLGPPLAPAAWHDPVYKAIVVRVGSKRQASISYDTELLRATAGWTGFLQFNPARFGIISPPRPEGPVTFVTPSLPGWSLTDEFPNYRADHRYGPLPKDVAHYEGLYRHGWRVVLKSRVSSVERRETDGKAEGPGLRDKRRSDGASPSLAPQPSSLTEIFETPWLEETPDASAFTRTLLIGPTKAALRMIVADPKARVRLHPRSQNAVVAPGHGGCAVLTVAPHDDPVTVKLLIASPDTNDAALDKLVAASPAPEDVLALTKPGPTIWGEPLVTKGERRRESRVESQEPEKSRGSSAESREPEKSRVSSAESREPVKGKSSSSSLALDTRLSTLDSSLALDFPYTVDTITLPFDNPFNALFFCGGHDFLPDGRAFVCTLHGDVWMVEGIDEKLERITWRRFATGLFQPLGVKCRVSENSRETRVESREPDKGKMSVRRGSSDPAETRDRRSPLPTDSETTAKEETFGQDAVRGQETRAQQHESSSPALDSQPSTLDSSPALDTRHSTLDSLFVVGRDQITRLHDLNGDGEADFYENFNNDAHVTMNGHEYVACLEADRAGNLYYVKGNNNSQTPHDGSVLRVSADGSKLDVFATGFRNPNGMGMGPHDELTVAPQEGEWTPASGVFDVREGGFYGMMSSHHWATPPTDFIRPICWFARRDDNSSGGQVWTTSDHWGPLANQLLHMSYGQCRLRLVLRESRVPEKSRESSDESREPEKKADGAAIPSVDQPNLSGSRHSTLHSRPSLDTRPFNGGSIELPLRFNSGIHRGRMNPRDGQLYVTGLRGWTTSAVHDGCFQRVRYVGGESVKRRESNVESREPEKNREEPSDHQPSTIDPEPFPIAMKTYSNGVALTFTSELDRETAEDPSSYDIEAWNYKWSAAYGSPEFKPSSPAQVGRDEIEPKSVTLLEDNRTLFIELPGVKPVDQLKVNYTLLTQTKTAFEQMFTFTLNSIPDQTIPDGKLHRPQPTTRPDGRLVAGISVRSDVLLDEQGHRMFAWSIPAVADPKKTVANPPTVRAAAWLQVPSTGEYRFTHEGTGSATVSFHGTEDKWQALSESNSVAVRLKRGLNEIAVRYELPRDGDARFRLMWESVRFPREAVPATSLFRRYPPHDVGAAFWDAFSEGQIAYQKHNCARCHESSVAGRFEGFRNSTPFALRGAPRLEESSRRFTSAWLAHWLIDPARLKRDSTMPGLIPKNEPQMAVDVAAYLGSLKETTSPVEPLTGRTGSEDEAIQRGGELFERLGCIACHRFTEAGHDDEWRRVSLHFAKAKFPPEALERFLLTPHRHHATSFMPDFRLTVDEASLLAMYIRRQSRGELNELAGTQPGSIERGRHAFEKLKCGQCHTMRPDDALPAAHLPSVFREAPRRGCLATNGDAVQKAPRFMFTEETRHRLQGFVTLMADAQRVEAGMPKLAAYSLAETMTALRCNACHMRDEQRSLWPEIVAEEGSGRLVEAVPQLTWVGEKLQGPWIEKLLKGEIKQKPRPWLTARMPSFPAYAGILAHGMAAEHGVPFEEPLPKDLNPDRVEIGRQLTLRDGGLDCRQCHGVGKELPRGDASTQIALGINFALARERLRPEFALRQMLDPPRYDPGSRMPRFAPDLRTTAAKQIENGDAKKQFELLKEFLWSVRGE